MKTETYDVKEKKIEAKNSKLRFLDTSMRVHT